MKIICAKALIHIYSFLLLTSYFSLIHAQAPDTLWTKTYGGGTHDWAYCVQQTIDNGYVIVGQTWYHAQGYGQDDVYILKTDSLGDSLWTRIYGTSSYEMGQHIEQTLDGGYIIAGSRKYGNDMAFWLIKTDVLGDSQWTKTFADIYDAYCYCVQQTSDGGYVLVGEAPNQTIIKDVRLIKTDSLGDVQWDKKFGCVIDDCGYFVRQTFDKGYIITGITDSGGPCNALLLKTDSLGNELWFRYFGESLYIDVGTCVRQTADSGYIITGYTESYGNIGYFDVWLIKTDSNGYEQWMRTYESVFNYVSMGQAVQLTSDNGYVVTGRTHYMGPDIMILKTTETGDCQWTKIIGRDRSDSGWSIQQTNDGGYIIVGRVGTSGSGSDVWLIKTEPDTLSIKEHKIYPVECKNSGATIVSGPLLLPEGKNCKVFDITGRIAAPDKIKPGIYFIEIDGQITKKVIKVR